MSLACKVCTPRTVIDQMSERGCTCLAHCGNHGCTGSRALRAGYPVPVPSVPRLRPDRAEVRRLLPGSGGERAVQALPWSFS